MELFFIYLGVVSTTVMVVIALLALPVFRLTQISRVFITSWLLLAVFVEAAFIRRLSELKGKEAKSYRRPARRYKRTKVEWQKRPDRERENRKMEA